MHGFPNYTSHYTDVIPQVQTRTLSSTGYTPTTPELMQHICNDIKDTVHCTWANQIYLLDRWYSLRLCTPVANLPLFWSTWSICTIFTFPAKTYSSKYSSSLEHIDLDWVTYHYMQWDILPNHSVVLSLTQVCCSFHPSMRFVLLLITGIFVSYIAESHFMNF